MARSDDWCSGDGAAIDTVAGYAIRPFAVTQERFAPAAKLAMGGTRVRSARQ